MLAFIISSLLLTLPGDAVSEHSSASFSVTMKDGKVVERNGDEASVRRMLAQFPEVEAMLDRFEREQGLSGGGVAPPVPPLAGGAASSAEDLLERVKRMQAEALAKAAEDARRAGKTDATKRDGTSTTDATSAKSEDSASDSSSSSSSSVESSSSHESSSSDSARDSRRSSKDRRAKDAASKPRARDPAERAGSRPASRGTTPAPSMGRKAAPAPKPTPSSRAGG
ncbi:MAG: hypothetical protein IT459_20560 [Planctomycetes bacterium]|nr:hypothetical protein [Planctomycetota bacterium]